MSYRIYSLWKMDTTKDTDTAQNEVVLDNVCSLSEESKNVDIKSSESTNQCVQGSQEVPTTRERKLTPKGKEYQLEMLCRNRSVAHGKLLMQIKLVKTLLERCARLEELEHARDVLDEEKENFNDAHNSYDQMLDSIESKDTSYKWFDIRDREYYECRLKMCERIHTMEREADSKPPSVKSSRSSHSDKSKKTSITSKSSSSSAHSRRIRAAAKAAKLEVEMKFLYKETEFKRLQMMKEIEMANAEEHAMIKIEEEDNVTSCSHLKLQIRSQVKTTLVNIQSGQGWLKITSSKGLELTLV